MENIQTERKPNATSHDGCTTEHMNARLKETSAWNGKKLNVRTPETKNEKINKHQIAKDAMLQNAKPNAVMIGMTIAFFIPIVIFWIVAINTSWLFLVGSAMFAICDGMVAWFTIGGEIKRLRRVKNIQNKGISLLERTCTDKKCGDCDIGEQIAFVYQLFFGDVNYRISQTVYDQININDKLMFVCTESEELPIAYPVKDWNFED